MIKISVNDFINILGNADVKSKLSDIFNESIQTAIQKIVDNVTVMTDKINQLSSAVLSLL